MSEERPIQAPEPPSDEALARLPEHPRGTMAILLIYAALWVVGWGLLFGWLFLGRGAPSG